MSDPSAPVVEALIPIGRLSPEELAAARMVRGPSIQEGAAEQLERAKREHGA